MPPVLGTNVLASLPLSVQPEIQLDKQVLNSMVVIGQLDCKFIGKTAIPLGIVHLLNLYSNIKPPYSYSVCY